MTFPPPPDLPRKPDVVPSNDVYISPVAHPSGRYTARMTDFWNCSGLRLREMLSDLYDLPESRIDLQAPIDDGDRYDFVLVPPRLESPETMRTLMQAGIAKHFGLQFHREVRTIDVCVMTAPNGVSGLHAQGGGVGALSMDMEVPEGFEGLSEDEQRAFFERHLRERIGAVEGRRPGLAQPTGHVGASGDCTTEQLSRMLEGMLDRIVVDETGADGGFAIEISTNAGVDGFLDALRDRLGILVARDRRDVEMLVVRAQTPT